MPKLPLPFNLPLKVRGIQGVISIIFITPHFPSYPSTSLRTSLKRGDSNRGIFGKLMKSGYSGGKTV